MKAQRIAIEILTSFCFRSYTIAHFRTRTIATWEPIYMFEALNIGPKGHNYASKSIFRYGEQNEVMVARLRYDYTPGKINSYHTLTKKSLATLDGEIVDTEIAVKLEMRDVLKVHDVRS